MSRLSQYTLTQARIVFRSIRSSKEIVGKVKRAFSKSGCPDSILKEFDKMLNRCVDEC